MSICMFLIFYIQNVNINLNKNIFYNNKNFSLKYIELES